MKASISLFFYIVATSVFAQTLTFNMGQPFREFRTLEDRLNSTVRENAAIHMLAADMAQPVAYLRTNDNFNPQPIVQYFFRKADSTVQEILYEWDKKNFWERGYKPGEQDVESKERLDEFVKKYTELKNEIIKSFGDSKSEGSLDPKAGIDYLKVDKRDSWQKGNVSVLMYITFTNQYRVQGNVSFLPAHRIRVYVNVKSPVQSSPAPPENLKTVFKADERQQQQAQEYIELLLKGEFEDSWKLISPEFKSGTKYETYETAMTSIQQLEAEFGKEIELFMSGPKFINNETFYSYSFKFRSDKSTPPHVLLEVTFTPGSSWIMGFQPSKLGKKKN